MAGEPETLASSQRIDQWLWFARIVKSRTLAQALIERGKVRLNRDRITKSSLTVKPGDVITISLGPKVRVVQISAIGERRGPAVEAARLYVELTPPQGETTTHSKGATAQNSVANSATVASAVREPGAGRPTKRDRRAISRLKGEL